MNIYEKIFARLEELHMSQIELSRRTGIATSTISDWRKKKINPQADKLMSICKALDMSLAELLCDEEVVERTIEPDFMVDGQNIIELLRTFDFETKRRILRYFELIEICREINRENSSQKIKRNVSVIQDIDGNNIVMINDIRFRKTFCRLERCQGILKRIRWRVLYYCCNRRCYFHWFRSS